MMAENKNKICYVIKNAIIGAICNMDNETIWECINKSLEEKKHKVLAIDVEELTKAIQATDWYHIHNGELKKGANGVTDEPLYKWEDIKNVIYGLPKFEALKEETND